MPNYAQPIIDFTTCQTGFSSPVDIANAGDGTDRLFIVERGGVIKIIENDVVLATPFIDIDSRVLSGGERGLLGLAFHPNYATNGYFYVNYINNSGDTRISRFEVNANNANLANPNSEVILLEMEQPYSNHNAGDLDFGTYDNYLYIGMGDGGSGGDPGNRSQDNDCLLGKMLRIDVDGGGNPASTSQSGGNCDFISSANYTIPADNPFVGDPNVLDEIWSIGLRNPWRFSFDSANGDMWIADVGQNAWEEVHCESSGSGGANYGWRCYEGSYVYNANGCGPANNYVDPVFEYDHSNTGGYSITGGYVYRGSMYPNMVGYYIVTDYVTENVWALSKDVNGNVTSTAYTDIAGINSISTFGIDEDGELYAASLNGTIYKVVDNSLLPVELIDFSGYEDIGINILKWSTESESNTDSFEIEKSNDGENFTSIGKVEAQGNSNTLQKYQFEDRLTSSGSNYYRLKIMDKNGQFEYSKTIEIFTQKELGISIFPNPNDGVFRLALNGDLKEDKAEVKVFNIVGELVLRDEVDTITKFEKNYDFSDQPKGIYIIRFKSGDFMSAKRMVLR